MDNRGATIFVIFLNFRVELSSVAKEEIFFAVNFGCKCTFFTLYRVATHLPLYSGVHQQSTTRTRADIQFPKRVASDGNTMHRTAASRSSGKQLAGGATVGHSGPNTIYNVLRLFHLTTVIHKLANTKLFPCVLMG